MFPHWMLIADHKKKDIVFIYGGGYLNLGLLKLITIDGSSNYLNAINEARSLIQAKLDANNCVTDEDRSEITDIIFTKYIEHH